MSPPGLNNEAQSATSRVQKLKHHISQVTQSGQVFADQSWQEDVLPARSEARPASTLYVRNLTNIHIHIHAQYEVALYIITALIDEIRRSLPSQ